MNIQLNKKTTKKSKRIGRGYGSGKGGHTSSRGQKGQKTRNKMNILFEGVKVRKSFVKRLPIVRGKGKFASKTKPVVVNVKDLNDLPKGTVVNVESLIKAGLVNAKEAKLRGVKVLGDGDLKNKLVFEVPMSKKLEEKINPSELKKDKK